MGENSGCPPSTRWVTLSAAPAAMAVIPALMARPRFACGLQRPCRFPLSGRAASMSWTRASCLHVYMMLDTVYRNMR